MIKKLLNLFSTPKKLIAVSEPHAKDGNQDPETYTLIMEVLNSASGKDVTSTTCISAEWLDASDLVRLKLKGGTIFSVEVLRTSVIINKGVELSSEETCQLSVHYTGLIRERCFHLSEEFYTLKRKAADKDATDLLKGILGESNKD